MALARFTVALSVAALLACASTASAQTAAPGSYTLDRTASVVGFTISGSMLFKMTEKGRFRDFSGAVSYDPAQPGRTHVDLTVYTASVDMGDVKRDELLKSTDFFDAEHFPTMHFVSASTNTLPDGTISMTGDMTIHGITRRMTIPVSFRPDAAWNGPARGIFESTFQIDRTEFGINGIPKWNGLKVSVSKNVQIHIAMATTLAQRP
jgi:polyisoprenoid-binding protein YceI